GKGIGLGMSLLLRVFCPQLYSNVAVASQLGRKVAPALPASYLSRTIRPGENAIDMATKRIGIIMHGVTGRMGTNQHLDRSILEIRRQGGVVLSDGTRLIPDPILVGRDAHKLESIAKARGVERWTTDLDQALANRDDMVFFDSASTQLRPQFLTRAIAAGKHVYCEKPVAATTAEALELYQAAEKAGIKHGVVQDKLWLPGL